MTISKNIAANTCHLFFNAAKTHGLNHRVQYDAQLRIVRNVAMLASPPTMTEHRIFNWGYKDRNPCSAGGILLAMGSDKSQMVVAAQAGGKVVQITRQTGAKSLEVGSQMPIVAYRDDDPATLKPPLGHISVQSSRVSGRRPLAQSSRAFRSKHPIYASQVRNLATSSNHERKYPLFPSITQILHENGLPLSETDKISATGPKGRLLKGDILAYLGKIGSTYSTEQSQRISELGRLDLNNTSPPRPKRPLSIAEIPAQKNVATQEHSLAAETDVVVALPISLSSVASVQRTIKASLGITLPLSTFVARATEMANESLPIASHRRVSADELFYAIIAEDTSSRPPSHGSFVPQMSRVRPDLCTEFPRSATSHSDIYDVLTGTQRKAPKERTSSGPDSSTPDSQNLKDVFSVGAAKGEERRARIFLERLKTLLQIEPGRLILYSGMHCA